jgi:hypothetical protein
MNLRPLAIAASFVAAAGAAQATVVTSTVGTTTTYTENFDGGTSFSSGWFNVPFSGDDFLFLNTVNPTSSFSFTSAMPLSSLSVSFWYSVPGSDDGKLTLGGDVPIALADTPGNAAQFLINNPGPATGGLFNANDFDSLYATSIFNVASGAYTVTFSTTGDLLDGFKVDDLVITAVAVPEPETYALLALGLMGIAIGSRKLRRR